MYALEINNLKKRYPKTVALDGIDLKVKQGDFFGLLGPNGAGKTTIIGILSSLTNKDSGEVKVCGVSQDDDIDFTKSMIGLVPQEFNFNNFEKVQDIIVQQAGYYGIARAEATEYAEILIKQLGLWDKRKEQSSKLSGGMKRRLMIARALIHKPKILLLDEPTVGVDIEQRKLTWEFLRKINREGTTIILTTHYLDEAENLCNGMGIINKGKIIKQTTVKSLLSYLDKETLVLDLEKPLEKDIHITGYDITKIDDVTLEISCPKNLPLNYLFSYLTENDIQVFSLKNKANRLEQLLSDLLV